jgi:hypothetical protein
MDERDLRLDGNAVAGLLATLFPFEMTANWTTCNGCNADHQLGALLAYGHGMGAVLRCPGCDTVQIRIVEGSGRIWLDLRGVRCLQLAVP